jgi:hypothetical protein
MQSETLHVLLTSVQRDGYPTLARLCSGVRPTIMCRRQNIAISLSLFQIIPATNNEDPDSPPMQLQPNFSESRFSGRQDQGSLQSSPPRPVVLKHFSNTVLCTLMTTSKNNLAIYFVWLQNSVSYLMRTSFKNFNQRSLEPMCT